MLLACYATFPKTVLLSASQLSDKAAARLPTHGKPHAPHLCQLGAQPLNLVLLGVARLPPEAHNAVKAVQRICRHTASAASALGRGCRWRRRREQEPRWLSLSALRHAAAAAAPAANCHSAQLGLQSFHQLIAAGQLQCDGAAVLLGLCKLPPAGFHLAAQPLAQLLHLVRLQGAGMQMPDIEMQ